MAFNLFMDIFAILATKPIIFIGQDLDILQSVLSQVQIKGFWFGPWPQKAFIAFSWRQITLKRVCKNGTSISTWDATVKLIWKLPTVTLDMIIDQFFHPTYNLLNNTHHLYNEQLWQFPNCFKLTLNPHTILDLDLGNIHYAMGRMTISLKTSCVEI